jgi:hypothetical protein
VPFQFKLRWVFAKAAQKAALCETRRQGNHATDAHGDDFCPNADKRAVYSKPLAKIKSAVSIPMK